jgi:Tol biopolymer transport system component/DNA-binding winged helix-turn-helix (wHTH) protein
MAPGTRVYQFGPFRLDSGERALYRDGQPVALTPKLAATLIVLIEKRGHIVEKAELMQSVWPDTIVEEGNLTQNVHSLRKLLGDRIASGVIIETVARRGYRLMGNVIEESAGDPQIARAHVDPQSEHAAAPIAVAGTPRVWVSAAVVLAVSVGILAWSSPWRMPIADAVASDPRGAHRIVPVTSLPGEKVRPAISPDGTRVTFSWNRGEGHDLYVKNTATDATLLLARGGSYSAWSPDGISVAFIRRFIDEHGDPQAAVLTVPAHGGSTRQLWIAPAPLVGTGLDWSPDGKHVVLSARTAVGMPQRLLVIATASGEPRWLSDPPAGSDGDTLPIFSPAGDSIAFSRETERDSFIGIMRLAGGELRQLSSGGHSVGRLAWDRDGHALVFSAGRQGNGLWRVSIATGKTEPIPGVGEGAGDPSVSRLSGRLVFTQTLLDQNLYRVDLRAHLKTPVRLLSASTRRDVQGDISPDGSRIAFASTRSGAAEIWTTELDGSAPAQLTDLRTACRHPRWSPDGRSIAFSASEPGTRRQHIYVVDASSGLVRRLTSGSSIDGWPTWSRDARWVYFTSTDSAVREIWKVPIGGGPATQVTKSDALKAWESSDGQSLFYSTDRAALWRMPVVGGPSELVFEFPPGTAWGGEWVPANTGIYWMNEALPRPTIELLTLATGQVTTVFTPPGDYDAGGGFSVSSDERWLVIGQRDYFTSDIMMVDKLR